MLLLMITCTEGTKFSAVCVDPNDIRCSNTTSVPLKSEDDLTKTDASADIELCFAIYRDGDYICDANTTKSVSYNYCSESSVTMLKARHKTGATSGEFKFYFNGAEFTETVINGTNSVAGTIRNDCANRNDLFCYCPVNNSNINYKVVAKASNNSSNYLAVNLSARPPAKPENLSFSTEVIFVSDYQCNANYTLQPKINIFNFDASNWNVSSNTLHTERYSFMPVLFSEGQSAMFGAAGLSFDCASEFFTFTGRDKLNSWCIAMEDWYCGYNSDRDYDFVIVYENEKPLDPNIEGRIRLFFKKISPFGADNFHEVKFKFADANSRILEIKVGPHVSSVNINSSEYTWRMIDNNPTLDLAALLLEGGEILYTVKKVNAN